MVVNFVSANRTADSKTTTQSLTTPATRMVKALVCVITRKTDKFRAKVQRQLRISKTGGKFHGPCSSIFDFSRNIHGRNKQSALQKNPKLFSQASIYTEII